MSSSVYYNKLRIYAENNLNVMLVGTHGIGKTTLVKQVADNLGLNLCYYSASTLDPWTDVVGVPKPVDSEEEGSAGYLEFYRPKRIQEAEFLFFDELNRAHPRVLNAVLEIVQFKTINGQPLDKLKMVWAAINPPGSDYVVEDLDPALVDRFHVYLKMEASFPKEYMISKMEKSTASALDAWWNTDLDTAQRAVVTPRRLEYLGFLIDREIPWVDALPQGHTIPHQALSRRLKLMSQGLEDMEITKESILSNVEKFVKRLKVEPSLAIPLSDVVTFLNTDDFFACRDIVELLPADLINKIGEKKFAVKRRAIVKKFNDEGVDLKEYPKITKGYRLKSI